MKKIEKILQFIRNKGITNKHFEETVGVSNGYLRNIAKTGSEISGKMLSKMLLAYPELENELEKGNDFSNGLELNPGNVSVSKSGNMFMDMGHDMFLMLTPLVHEYAYAGYLKGFADSEYIGELPKHAIVVTAKHRGIYRTFVAIGDSMDNGLEDAIKDGDKVTGRLLPFDSWTSKLHLHRYREWIIHHKDGIIIKEIISHDVESGIVGIRSKNPDKDEFPDQELSLADCKELYNVVVVTKERRL